MSEKMYELREILCEELDKLAPRGELSAGELETAHKITDTIKNIDKICMMEEDGGYSGDGEWEAMGNYSRGNSYRRQSRDSMGRYSRADRSYMDGNSMRGRGGYGGRYSRADEMEHIEKKMREMLDSGTLTGSQRDALTQAMTMLREA